MNQQRYEQQMTQMAIAYGVDLSAPQLKVYWDHLGKISDEVFAEAIDRLVKRERQFPNVAMLHGYCDRVKEEWAEEQAKRDESATLRLGAGDMRLPTCGVCNDLGWYHVPNPAPNLPSTLVKCDCAQAFKGRDPAFGMKQVNAGYYHATRNSASRPEQPPAPAERFVPDDPGPNFHRGGVPVPETREDRMKAARAAQIASNIAHVAKSMTMNAPRAPASDPAPKDA